MRPTGSIQRTAHVAVAVIVGGILIPFHVPPAPVSAATTSGSSVRFQSVDTDHAETVRPVTVAADAAWAASVRVNDDAGAQTQQERPAVVIAPNGSAYAIWDDMRTGNQTDVYFAHRDSVTGVWGTNEKINDDSTSRAQWRADIAVDGSNNAYAVWQDAREGNQSGDHNVYFSKRSATTGTWSPNLRVNDDKRRDVQTSPQIAVTPAGDAVAVWVDRRSGQWNIYSSRLAAGSSTWEPNLRVTDNTSSRKDSPDVVVAPDGTAYAVWEDDRSGNWDVYWSELPTGSSAWTTNSRLSDDPDTYAQYSPVIGADSVGNVFVVWLDDRAPTTEVRSRLLPAGSETWGPSQIASDPSAYLPSDLALGVAPSGEALAVWADGRGASWDIWGASYEPASQQWSVSRLVSDDPGDTHQLHPAAAVRGDTEAAVWFDARESYLGDIRASTHPLPSATVSWSAASIAVSVQLGTSVLDHLTLTSDQDVADGSIAIDAAIGGLVTPAAELPFDLEAGVEYQVPMVFDVPKATTPGTYEGDVSIVSAAEEILGSIAVSIDVVEPPGGVIPEDVPTPSRDRIGTNAAGNSLVVDELLVALDFETAEPQSRILSLASAYGGTIVGSIPDALVFQVRFPDVANPAELEPIRASLLTEADVAFVATNQVSQSLEAIPDDPEWHEWDEGNPSGDNWSMELIHAPSAWDIATGDRSVPVAIIDADINTDHEDLSANVDLHDGIRVPQRGQEAHGTHVAGIACAVGNNGVGVTGVAWQCSLRAYELSFATIGPPQTPPPTPTTEVHQTEATKAARMVHAATGGARVVNMSWGSDFGMCDAPTPERQRDLDDSLDLLGRSIEAAIHEGLDVLWVAAAGNEPCDAGRISPAGLSLRFPDNVITVAAVNHDGDLTSYSARGDAVSVAAPGGEPPPFPDVLSTKWDNASCHVLIFFDCVPYGGYHGTSQAAPHVTGLAALVLSAHPGFSAAEVKACIVNGAVTQGLPIDGEDFHVLDAPAAVGCHGIRVHDRFEPGDIVVSTGGYFVRFDRHPRGCL